MITFCYPYREEVCSPSPCQLVGIEAAVSCFSRVLLESVISSDQKDWVINDSILPATLSSSLVVKLDTLASTGIKGLKGMIKDDIKRRFPAAKENPIMFCRPLYTEYSNLYEWIIV